MQRDQKYRHHPGSGFLVIYNAASNLTSEKDGKSSQVKDKARAGDYALDPKSRVHKVCTDPLALPRVWSVYLDPFSLLRLRVRIDSLASSGTIKGLVSPSTPRNHPSMVFSPIISETSLSGLLYH